VIIVDAMNVRGCIPDGWWRDKDGALGQLVSAIANYRWSTDDWVVVIADGRPVAGLHAGTRGQVELRYAGHSSRDAADDDIVALAHELAEGGEDDDPIVVVTSDRGLVARLPAAATVEGARTFRRRVGF
jgi:predicted RNA-binding protein with PIN domain